MWKIVWMTVLVLGMAGFVVTATLVAIRGLPELKSLLGLDDQSRQDPPPKDRS